MSVSTHLQQKTKILYIDDDCELVDIYSRFFEGSDYLFKTAYNAETGYEIARLFIPDIIISDVAMPGLSGLELCRQIREDTELTDVIFILVSGIDVEPEDIIDGLGAGADDYLVKPFMRDVLFAKIRSSLRLKKIKDSLRYTEALLEESRLEQKELANRLDETNEILSREKDLLVNSLKQITLMSEKEKRNTADIKKMNARLEADEINMVSLLSSLIESRPQYHRGHGLNVSNIAYDLAQMLALPESEAKDIKTAGLLHEIGRLMIPDSVSVTPPGELSQSEADLMIQHPVKGAALLDPFPALCGVKKIIRHIHENVDGTGYPDSLSATRIPVGARIIAVASAFDNIMFRGEKRSVDTVFDILDAEAGTRFDPKIINLLRKYVTRNPMEYEKNFAEVRLFEVKPGMKLAAGLYTLKGAKLLPENTVLTEENIEKIARYNKIDMLEETVFIKE